MGWTNDAADALLAGRSIQVQPYGGSMKGRVESGQLVTLMPASGREISPDVVVFVRWSGHYLLHKVIEVNSDSVLIGNNLGKINGAAQLTDVLGVMIDVCDEPTCPGTVMRHLNNMTWLVQLDDDREVIARLPKSVARDIFRMVPGDRMLIGGLWNSDFQILSFAQNPPNKMLDRSGGSTTS